jgi:predicted S18 family serine protease
MARRLALCLMLGVLAAGCSVPPATHQSAPVQEMSDARQAIQAAKSANSERYTPESLQEAERLLDKAAASLSRGDYREARNAALSAREHAIAARRATLSIQRME